MRPIPSGQKTSLTPISLHAFQTKTPQLGPMLFKYEKIFFGPSLSPSLWPSVHNIVTGLRPMVPV